MEETRTLRQESSCQKSENQETEQQKPVKLLDFIKEVSKLLGLTKGGAFLYKASSNWLIQNGYIIKETAEDNGKKQIVITVMPKGAEAGLLISEPDEKGSLALLCNQKAQDFLKNNLERIMVWERTQWEPLRNCLTAEHLQRIACLLEPDKSLNITNLLKKISSRLPDDLPRNLAPAQINIWMTRNGFLKQHYKVNATAYSPTMRGKEIGLTAVKNVISWQPQAQQFLLDHLVNIVQDIASGEAFRFPAVPKQLEGAEAVRAQLQYNGQTLNIYKIEEWINRSLASAAKGNYWLPYGVLFIWLKQQGYYAMKDLNGSGKKILVCTALGRSAGFSIDDNHYIMLSDSAQHLVADHLEDIWTLYYHLDNGD